MTKLLVTPDANSSVNVAQVGGSAVATAATGIAKVGLTDGTGTAITSTSNALDINIKSGSTTLATGLSANASLATWTSATSINTAASISTSSGAYSNAIITLACNSGSFSAGNVSVEGTTDGSNWVGLSGFIIDSSSIESNPITLVTSSYLAISYPTNGMSNIRVRLNQAITGTGSLVVGYSLGTLPAAPINSGNASVSTSAGPIGTQTTWIGAYDGSLDLVGCQLESGLNPNLRVAIFNGTLEAQVTGAGRLKIDGSGTTQPISAASLPLPTGASTSAKQAALGTAGTASADVITVQGIASMTALKVDGSGVTQPVSGTVAVSNSFALDASVTGLQVAQASTTSGQKGGLALGAVTTAAPTYTTAQSDPLSLDTSGLLRVSLKDTPANTNKFLVTADAITFASAQHVIADSGTITTITNAVTVAGAAASGASKSGNPVQIGGVFNTTQPTVTTGQAVEAQSTARGAQIVATGADTFHVTVDSAPSTAVTNAGTFATQATLSAETTKVIGTVNIASSQTIGIAAGSAVIGHVIVDTAPSTAVTNAGTFAVQQTPKTSGGLGLPFSASVNATKAQVKATAGNVYGWNIVNNTAAIAYCQVFNLASASVTVGSTAPDYVIAIPGNSTTGAGNSVALDLGISHSTGITIACTTTRTGSTNAACDVLFFFN